MKRVIALLLCLVMVVCCIAACGNDTPDEVHSHTYSETWSSDAVGHWYMATCDCEDVEEKKFSHADKNNDGACDVCEYKTACADGHTYSDDWTIDCTNHWNAADCGHVVPGANVASHVDTNNDGECDVCKYVIEDIHNHYYDTAWTGDEQYHWHAALCEHAVEVADKAAHVLNAAGYCTVCDAKVVEVDPSDLAAILAAAVARNDKVAYGDVIAIDSVYGGTGAQTLENGKTNKVHFALGNGESYVQYISFDMNGNYIGQEEQWFEDLGNGEVFAVAMLDGNYELSPIMGSAQFLNGYNYIPGSVIPSDSADTSTLANMLSALYSQMKAGTRVSNATESIEDGVYAFSYTYYSVNAQTTSGAVYNVEIEYYNVDVEFTVNEDLIIDMANFQVEVYRDYEGDSDLSYTYVDNGDGTVTISDLALKATANPTFYTYSVAQTSGERTFTTPYPRASLLPSGFDLLYVLETVQDENLNPVPSVTEKIGDTLEIVAGTYAKFAIGEIYPITASSKFINSDDFAFSFVNNDPNSEGVAWDMEKDAILNGYNVNPLNGIGMLKLKLCDAGEYTVTLGFGDVTETFILKITEAPVTEITGDADSISVKLTDFNTYDNEEQSYYYTATAEGNYTFTIPAGLGARLDGETNPKVDFTNSPNGGSFTVGLNEGDRVKIYFAAANSNTYEVTVAYVAADIPDSDVGGGDEGDEGGSGSIAADISGTYYTERGVLVINADGTMTYTEGPVVQNYTYSIEGDNVTYTLNGNAPYDSNNMMASYFGYLKFGSDGMPTTFVYNGNHALSTTAPGGGDEGGDDEGGDDDGDTLTGSGTEASPYVLPQAGDYTCAFPGGYSPIWYTFTATENCYVTVSTTFASGWLQLGADFYAASMNSNGGNGADVKTLVLAGETVYIGVGDYDEAVVDVPFTVSTESVTFKPVDFLAGNWAGTEKAMWGNAEYIITFNANGTGNGSYDMGGGATEFDVTAIFYIGDEIIVKTVTTGEYGGTVADLIFTYSENTLTCASAMMWGELVLNPYSGEVGGGDDEEETPEYDTTIVAGQNTLWFSTDEIAVDTATRSLTITVDGNYSFNAGNLFVSGITDANGNPVAKNSDFTFDLVAGEYTITFGMLSMFGVSADVAQKLNVVNNNAEGGDEGDDDQGNEPNGSSDNPYVLTEPDNYTCEFPGGYDCVWYTFTPTESGYVTLSSTFGEGAWLQVGTDFYNLKSNSGDGTSVRAYVQAGVLCYVGVGDWSEVVSTVPFTVAFEAGELVPDGTTSAPYPVVLDTQTTANFLGNNPIWYYFNATASGYLTVTTAYSNANLQIGPDFYDTVCNVGFDASWNTVIAPSVTLYVTAGKTYYIGVYDNDYDAANIPFTVSFREFTSGSTAFLEGTWTGSESAWGESAVYNVVLGADGTGYGSYDMGYGPTTFDVTFALVDGTTVTLYTVTTGMYVGTSANLVFTYDAAAGTLTTDKGMMENALTLTLGAAGEGGSGDDEGTESNPYVVDELPYTITVNGNHDMYYAYTATEETTIEVTYVTGGLVSFSIDGETVSATNSNMTYTITVPAGKTIIINPWTMSSDEVDYTYVISVQEPGEGDDEGEDSGEVNGTTYLASNANGRKMQVIVYSDGTMTVTRSDMTGNFTGGATTANYTWEIVGGVFTFTKVGNNSITAMEFSADGTPISVTWSGVKYEGFTVQA